MNDVPDGAPLDYTCPSFHRLKHWGNRMRTLLGLAASLLALGSSLVMAQPVTTSDLENAAADNSSWLTYGRDYYGQRKEDQIPHCDSP